MGSESLPAINAKQFYVPVSRGRDDVAIYVDDKAKVRNAIARSGEQLSATELVSNREQEESQDREYDVTAQREEYRGQTRFQNFRERFVSWCKDQVQDRRTAEPSGRPELGMNFGTGIGGVSGTSPTPSRGL